MSSNDRSDVRFTAYLAELVGIIGHADRAASVQDYYPLPDSRCSKTTRLLNKSCGPLDLYNRSGTHVECAHTHNISSRSNHDLLILSSLSAVLFSSMSLLDWCKGRASLRPGNDVHLRRAPGR